MKKEQIKEQFEKAQKQIKDKKLIFIEDVIANLSISKFSFYNYFKVDSNEYNTLKELLDKTNKNNHCLQNVS